MVEASFIRMGIGFDAHSLQNGRKLFLGGVKIPFKRGLAGHSDADVLLHAITDALLGAAGLGDMGTYFPSSDEKFKDVSSVHLLREAVRMVVQEKFRINNVDTVIVAQEPKLAPYLSEMKKAISDALEVDPGSVNVKVKTTDGLGFLGRKEGIAAYAIATIISNEKTP